MTFSVYDCDLVSFSFSVSFHASTICLSKQIFNIRLLQLWSEYCVFQSLFWK